MCVDRRRRQSCIPSTQCILLNAKISWSMLLAPHIGKNNGRNSDRDLNPNDFIQCQCCLWCQSHSALCGTALGLPSGRRCSGNISGEHPGTALSEWPRSHSPGTNKNPLEWRFCWKYWLLQGQMALISNLWDREQVREHLKQGGSSEAYNNSLWLSQFMWSLQCNV